jgi:hypothetical protein
MDRLLRPCFSLPSAASISQQLRGAFQNGHLCDSGSVVRRAADPPVGASHAPFSLLGHLTAFDDITSSMARRAKLTPHDEFYAGIGRFVVQWTGMESTLDLLLLGTRPKQSAEQKVKLPHQLESKLKSIRAQIQYIDDPYRETIEQLLQEISRYASTRHDLMHGAIIDHVVNENTLLEMLKTKTRRS